MLSDIEFRFVYVLTGNEILKDGTWSPTSWEPRLQFRKEFSMSTPAGPGSFWTDWQEVPTERKP